MFVVARGCAAWCVSVESPKHRNVGLSSLCQGWFTQHRLVLSHRACGGCFMDLYSSCVLAFDKHVFVSWRAPHSTSPCKDTTLSKFHSHLSALVLRAEVQPGVCAHHALKVCMFISGGTYFRQPFALSPFSTIHWDIAQFVVGRACTFSCSCPSSQRAACTHTSQTFNFAHTTAKVARRATSEPRKVCIASLRVVVCRVCCCFLAAFLSFGPSLPWQATVLSRNTWNVHDVGHNGTSK